MTKQRAEPDLEDIISGAISDYAYSFYCHRVGTIKSFNPDSQTASIQLVDKGVFSTDQGDVIVDFPLLVNCPVMINKGAKGGFTIPVNEGDTCLVCFNDRDLDNWLVDGLTQRPNTLRAHDLSDGIAIVGIRNQINKITDYNNDATEINYLGSKISLDSEKISLINSSGNSIVLDDTKISLENSSGGSIVIDDKLELKNTAENLKGLIDELLIIITNLKTVDNPASPTITLVVDTPTTNALTALSTRVGDLLK